MLLIGMSPEYLMPGQRPHCPCPHCPACSAYFFFTCFMYRTPQALQSVLGPYGPARQTGVTCTG